MSFWSFLAVVIIVGAVCIMFQSYLEHKREMKKLELETRREEKDSTE